MKFRKNLRLGGILFTIVATASSRADDPCNFDYHKAKLNEDAECVVGSPMVTLSERTEVDQVIVLRYLDRTRQVSAICSIVSCDFKFPVHHLSHTEGYSWSVTIGGSASVTTSAKVALANVLVGALEVGGSFTGTLSSSGTWSYSQSDTMVTDVIQSACYDQIFDYYKTKSSVQGRVMIDEFYDWDIGSPCPPSVIRTTCSSQSFDGSAIKVTGEEVAMHLHLCCESPNCCGQGPCDP